MRATLDIPPPTHREQRPIRSCSRCGAYLRSFTDSDFCDPCAVPTIENTDEVDLIAAVAEISDSGYRQQGFEALAELMEQSGVAA